MIHSLLSDLAHDIRQEWEDIKDNFLDCFRGEQDEIIIYVEEEYEKD